MFEQVSTGQNFKVILRFDTEVDVLYYRHGGILNYMVRKMVRNPGSVNIIKIYDKCQANFV